MGTPEISPHREGWAQKLGKQNQKHSHSNESVNKTSKDIKKYNAKKDSQQKQQLEYEFIPDEV